MKQWENGIDQILRVLICVLLFGILIVQFLILERMPPTVGEIKIAKDEERKELYMKIPFVHVSGRVSVND
jgi:hypothetical protein